MHVWGEYTRGDNIEVQFATPRGVLSSTYRTFARDERSCMICAYVHHMALISGAFQHAYGPNN